MTCVTSKKSLKRELKRRGYSVEHLAKLARVSPHKKNGTKRTKKSLINRIVAKRSTGGLARLLGFKSSKSRSGKRGRGRCARGRKKTGKRGCKKKPGPKRGRRSRRRYTGGMGGSLYALTGRRKRASTCRNIWA